MSGVELKHVARKVPEPRYLRTSPHPAEAGHAQNAGGTSNPGSQNGLQSNEYDIIKETGQSRTTQRQQTENPLYGDHGTLSLQHPTLSDRHKHDSTQSSTLLIKSESPSSSASSGRSSCWSGALNCFLFVALSLALLVAVGALVIVLLLFTGTYHPTSASVQSTAGPPGVATTAPPSTLMTTPTSWSNWSNSSNTTSVNYQEIIDQLNTTARMLSNLLDSLMNQVDQNQSAIGRRIGSLVASGYTPDFRSCQTSPKSTCDMTQAIPFCITSAIQTPKSSDDVSVYCAVTDTGGDSNPIIKTTLVWTPEEGYKCRCQEIKPWSAQTFCALFVTTCPAVNITLRLA